MPALRFADGSDDIIEGVLVPFTSPFPENRDTYGTVFSNRTNFCLDWYRDRPLLYHHGQDEALGPMRIGTIRSLVVIPDVGVWMKAQVDTHNRYYAAIKDLMEEDALGLSSGSIDYLVDIDRKSGEVNTWPIVEGSMTPTAANPHAVIKGCAFRSFVDDTKLAEAVTDESEVLTLEAYRAKMDAKERNALKDSDFAYIDSDGGRHLPINDEEHVKNALARFDQTEFESDAAKAAAKKKILAAAKKFGIEVSPDDAAARSVDLTEKSFEDIRDDISGKLNPPDPFGYSPYVTIVATYPDHIIVCRYEDDDQSYWSIPYTLDDNNEPVLGAATEVQQVYEPVARSVLPLFLDARQLTAHASALQERTEDLLERRYREGRMLSATNYRQINDAITAMGTATSALRDLLTRADGMVEETARAAQFATPEARRLHLAVLDIL